MQLRVDRHAPRRLLPVYSARPGRSWHATIAGAAVGTGRRPELGHSGAGLPFLVIRARNIACVKLG